jgi:hypothetical protein
VQEPTRSKSRNKDIKDGCGGGWRPCAQSWLARRNIGSRVAAEPFFVLCEKGGKGRGEKRRGSKVVRIGPVPRAYDFRGPGSGLREPSIGSQGSFIAARGKGRRAARGSTPLPMTLAADRYTRANSRTRSLSLYLLLPSPSSFVLVTKPEARLYARGSSFFFFFFPFIIIIIIIIFIFPSFFFPRPSRSRPMESFGRSSLHSWPRLQLYPGLELS